MLTIMPTMYVYIIFYIIYYYIHIAHDYKHFLLPGGGWSEPWETEDPDDDGYF